MHRIDASDTQVGHIAHGANAEGHIKTRHGRTVRRPLQRANPLRPSRGVVVFRVKPFLPRILETFDHGQGLWYRLRSLDPGRGVSCRLVEFLQRGSIVAEIRPAHFLQVPARDQRLNVRLLRGAEIRQTHDKKSSCPHEACQVGRTRSHISSFHLIAHRLTAHPAPYSTGLNLRTFLG